MAPRKRGGKLDQPSRSSVKTAKHQAATPLEGSASPSPPPASRTTSSKGPPAIGSRSSKMFAPMEITSGASESDPNDKRPSFMKPPPGISVSSSGYINNPPHTSGQVKAAIQGAVDSSKARVTASQDLEFSDEDEITPSDPLWVHPDRMIEQSNRLHLQGAYLDGPEKSFQVSAAEIEPALKKTFSPGEVAQGDVDDLTTGLITCCFRSSE